MSSPLLLNDPLIREALTDAHRAVALLGDLSGHVELLCASPGFRDQMQTATRIARISELFGADVQRDLSHAVINQTGWAASCLARGSAHWTLLQVWPYKGLSLLFMHASEPVHASSSQDSESMYHLIHDTRSREQSLPDLVLTTTLQGTVTEAGKGLTQLLNLPARRFTGAALEQWIHGADIGLFKSMLNKASTAEGRVEGEFRMRNARGQIFGYQWQAVKTSGHVCWMGSAHNRSLAETLVKTEARLQLILENIEDGFMSLDSEWNLSFLNQKAALTFGRTLDQLLGKHLWTEMPELERTPFRNQLYRAVSTQLAHSFEWHDGHTWHLARCFPGQEGVSLFLSDITDIKTSEEKARHQALHDSLTGLPNRECARIELERGIENARRMDRRVAVLFMDLDGFKKVNDTRGHEIGDELLKLVAQRLKTCVRNSDVVARQSGDEFLLILNGIDGADSALQVGQKIVRTIGQNPFIIHADKVHVGASVGVALYPDHGTEAISLMKHADMAMYHIKQRTKNAVALFEDSMADGVQRKAMLEKIIRESLERKTLQVHYQPRFCTKTGQVQALEALARLRDAQGRLISPADFIGVAEETRLIAPLSLDVMEKAALFIREFNASQQSELRVSVNISVKHLQTGELAEQVTAVLQRTEMPPHWLELEIPESVLVMGIKNLRQQCDDLRALGVQLVIDNVGVQATHLTLLQDIRPSIAKFDRTLIRRIPDDAQACSLVEALHLALTRMGIDTVGEGVETEAQKAFLTSLGFGSLQGYALSIPMMDRDISQFLMQHPLMAVSEAKAQ